MSTNPNLIFEAEFKKTIEVYFHNEYIKNKRPPIKLAFPGILREFRGSSFLSVFWTEDKSITLFDKDEIKQIVLDGDEENDDK